MFQYWNIVDTVDTADIVHTVDTLDIVKSVNSVDNVSSVNSVHNVHNASNDAAAREAGRDLIFGIVDIVDTDAITTMKPSVPRLF